MELTLAWQLPGKLFDVRHYLLLAEVGPQPVNYFFPVSQLILPWLGSRLTPA